MWVLEFVKARPDLATIVALMSVMAVDTLLGLLIAAQDGKVSAAEMQQGVTKKVGTLLIVLGIQFLAVLMPDLERGAAMWEALLKEGLYVNLARPPATPANMTLLRCSL